MLGLVAAVMLASCKSDDADLDDDQHDHEEEVITDVKLTFTDQAGILPAQTFTFSDPDGVGGNDPVVFDTIQLADSNVYIVSVAFWNGSEDPAEDLTSEVEEEKDEHLLCFNQGGAVLTIELTDLDNNNLPVGLASKWTTGAAETGSVIVALKHQPDVKDGTCSPGETDIEVNFPLKIQ